MDAFSEPESFRLFVRENFRGLASFAQSILGSSFEAEDVAQETLILLHRGRARLRPDVSPRAFAYRIAQRLCFSRIRREARRKAIATLLAPLAARESPPLPDSIESWFRGLPRRRLKLVTRVEPSYPEKLHREKKAGIVVIQAIINTDGSVGPAAVVRHSDPGFDEAALAAVRQWRYEPASLRGKPVRVYVPITVTFRVD